MIEKKIHYCWFGGNPHTPLAEKCIDSFRKFFPDYEMIEWNENNFDVFSCRYAKEAFDAKKWAFVSDYARFKIIYDEGGIYFDTDVEVIRSFDDIVSSGAFMGAENPDVQTPLAINTGLGFGAESKDPFIKEMLMEYQSASFYNPDGSMDLTTVVERVTRRLEGKGAENSEKIQKVEGITIYPSEYFCPINMNTGRLVITENTRSIHRFEGSWVDTRKKLRGKAYFLLVRLFGERAAKRIRKALTGKS